MKKAFLIVGLIFAVGLVGCPHDYYGRDDHEHDQDTEHH